MKNTFDALPQEAPILRNVFQFKLSLLNTFSKHRSGKAKQNNRIFRVRVNHMLRGSKYTGCLRSRYGGWSPDVICSLVSLGYLHKKLICTAMLDAEFAQNVLRR